MLLFTIHSGFGRFNVASRAGFHFHKAQHVLIPSDQVDFTAMMGRAKVPRDHNVSAPTQEEVRVFFAALACPLMFGSFVSAQSVIREPIEDVDSGVSEATAEHALG